MQQELRLAGYGGQGIVLAGLILGKAATLYDGKEAVFTQSSTGHAAHSPGGHVPRGL